MYFLFKNGDIPASYVAVVYPRVNQKVSTERIIHPILGEVLQTCFSSPLVLAQQRLGHLGDFG